MHLVLSLENEVHKNKQETSTKANVKRLHMSGKKKRIFYFSGGIVFPLK